MSFNDVTPKVVLSRQYLYHSAIVESQIEISEVLSSKDIKPFPHFPPGERDREREGEGEESEGSHYLLVV